MHYRVLTTLLCGALVMWPQTRPPTDQGVTASASRTIAVPASEVLFAIYVSASLGAPLEDVLRAVEPAGVREQHLAGLSAYGVSSSFEDGSIAAPPNLHWLFQIVKPAAEMERTASLLDELGRKLPERVSNVTYGATLSPSQQDLDRARQSVLPDLMSEARLRAGALARAGGFTLGPILYVTDSSYSPDARAGMRMTFAVSVRYGRQ